jgi:hypothetical protein
MKDWELKLKMQDDLETIETEVKTSDKVVDALSKIEVRKNELEQMKPSTSKTDLCEKEDAAADAKSSSPQVQVHGCRY